MSKHSCRKLYRIINYWLNCIPPHNLENYSQCTHGIFDGTFFKRPNSIVMLMNASNHTIVAGNYPVRENSLLQLKTFLFSLKERNLSLKTVTVDGNPQAVKAFREIWPNITVQRCLVHIQRQGLMWCRAKPNMKLAYELRMLFLRVTYIRTHEEKDMFIHDLMQWEEQYGEMVSQFPSSHKVLSDITRARSMILNALPDMFHYLDDNCIPFSTNGLEGYFSRLKHHYRNHRGLTKNKRTKYFQWYMFLKPK